jgi:hypothetical protein
MPERVPLAPVQLTVHSIVSLSVWVSKTPGPDKFRRRCPLCRKLRQVDLLRCSKLSLHWQQAWKNPRIDCLLHPSEKGGLAPNRKVRGFFLGARGLASIIAPEGKP